MDISLGFVYAIVFGFVLVVTAYYSYRKEPAEDQGVPESTGLSSAEPEDEPDVPENNTKNNLIFLVTIILVCVLYLLLHNALNQKLLYHNPLDSYTLQAEAWWRGQTWLTGDYSYLELAEYGQKTYVSFPPVPSLVLFPLIPFFGADTPNNLLVTIYGVIGYIFIYLLCRRFGLSDWKAFFWALFTTAGSNILEVTVNGGVWFQAQALSFMLTAISLYLLKSPGKGRFAAALALWALSVGCRPFQIVYLPIYLWFYFEEMKREEVEADTPEFIKRSLGALAIPMIIGILIGAYNYLRFGNPLEFGHNYLPEFINAPKGQFSISYIFGNLLHSLRLPEINGRFDVLFPRFDGFAFYIANPIFIVFFIRLFKKRRYYIIPLCMAVHALLLLSHKTLGGWQFGARYFADMLPFALLYILLAKKNTRIQFHEIILWLAGMALNIYGALWLFLNWS